MGVVATEPLAVRLLDPRAQPPARTRPGDAGYDLRCLDGFRLAPGERATVGTGVAIALPPGVAGLVTPRSGLAARHGVSVVTAPAWWTRTTAASCASCWSTWATRRSRHAPAIASRSCCSVPYWAPELNVVEGAAAVG